MTRSLRCLRQVARVRHGHTTCHSASPLHLGVCEQSWLRYDNNINKIWHAFWTLRFSATWYWAKWPSTKTFGLKNYAKWPKAINRMTLPQVTTYWRHKPVVGNERRRPHTSHYLNGPVPTKKRPTTNSYEPLSQWTYRIKTTVKKTTNPTLIVELQRRKSVPTNSIWCNKFFQYLAILSFTNPREHKPHCQSEEPLR